MARPLRIEFPGAIYHVTVRGNARQAIYLDDADRAGFLDILAGAVERFSLALHAYCLMDNHYHLIVETPTACLARAMRHLNGVFTQRFNRRHGRVGHLFQGRYKAILVAREAYLLELARYVVLNPVRAGLCAAAGDWPWSSYRATAGESSPPGWLAADWLLAPFDGAGAAGRAAYKAFVAAGAGIDAWAGLRDQIYLGGEGFAEAMRGKARHVAEAAEAPRAQRLEAAPSLAEIVAGAGSRNEAIRVAWQTGRYRLAEIGAHFGLHYSTVSHIANPKRKT